jgi:hypothetical protein
MSRYYLSGLCQIEDCERPAQTFIDVNLVHMDEEGVTPLPTKVVAVCRIHAIREGPTPTIQGVA